MAEVQLMNRFMEIGSLVDSTPLVGDDGALRARFAEDGYLLVRNVMDPQVIAWARGRYRDALAAEGLIDPAVEAPVWTGNEPKTRRPCDALGTEVWHKMVRQPQLVALLTSIFGEPPVWVPIAAHRSALPTGEPAPDQDLFEGRHQDGYFNEGMNLTICWIPLMDINRTRGGFAIAPRTHGRGWFHSSEEPYKIPRDAFPGTLWRTIDFKVGDVLIFSDQIAHTGLPNPSNEIRMSLDVRAVPRSAPLPIVGIVNEVKGGQVSIHADSGDDVDVLIDDNTFIRDMDPRQRVPTAEVERIAFPGAHVIAMAGPDRKATVLRRNFY
jgi:hypothetical protein